MGQRELRLAAVQPGVLNDDGDVGLTEGGVVGVARHRGRIIQLVETQVTGAACRNGELVGTDRVAIGEVDRRHRLRAVWQLVASPAELGGVESWQVDHTEAHGAALGEQLGPSATR